MVDSTLPAALRSDATLPELLTSRARRASRRRLALDVAGGALAALTALLWRPGGWVVLLSAAGCFLAYGTWGLADRSLQALGPATPPRDAMREASLELLRAGAVLVGTVAAVGLVLSALAGGVGRVIS